MSEEEIWEDQSRDGSQGGSDDGEEAQGLLERAAALRDAGDLHDSLRLLKTLVAMRMRRQGRRSYDCQCALSQLGRTLRAMGQFSKACVLHWEVLAIRNEIHGRLNHLTQNSAGILADTLIMSNDPDTAAAVKFWLNLPEGPSPADRAAITQVENRLSAAIAARQKHVTRHVAKLVESYLKQPIRKRVLEAKSLQCSH